MVRYIKHVLYELKIFFFFFNIISQLTFSHVNQSLTTLNFMQLATLSNTFRINSVVNYNTAYSKAVHKYFLKAFYNKTNKKEYNL